MLTEFEHDPDADFTTEHETQISMEEASAQIEAELIAVGDAWFISFAQQTVDRMLIRYGIETVADDENNPGPSLSLAA
jgi:hypothetical protein